MADDADTSSPCFAGERRQHLNVKRHAMLKDLSGTSEDPDFTSENGLAQPGVEAGPATLNRDYGRFRAALWLDLTADIRRRRALKEMKGTVPC